MRRPTLVLPLLLSMLWATGASAATQGPLYPVPAWHGGNQCVPSSSTPGQAGLSGGMTWSYGGGGDSPSASSDTCDGTGTPPPFDSTKFEGLFWGINKDHPPQLAMDGAVTPGTDETMTFSAAQSDLNTGRLVWTGTTQMLGACAPAPCINFGVVNVDTKLTLQFTNTSGGGSSPATLVDPATAGVDPSVGGVVSVSPALTNFDANFRFTASVSGGGATQPALLFYNSYSHQNPAQAAISHFTGAFYLITHPPIAAFSCTPAAPVAGDTITCTSSSTDPDGQPDAPLTEKWDWNGNGSTSDPVDQTGHSASGTFDAGTHTIVLHALDNEGGEGTVIKQIVVAAPPGTPGGDTTTGGTTGTPIGTPIVAPSGGSTGTDKTAPVASLALSKAKLKALLKKGLAGSLTSNEAGTGKLSLTLPAKLAKKLKLKGAVGSVTVRITTAGTKTFTIKLSKKAANKLAKLKSVAFKVKGTVTDQAGNRTAVSKSITIKR